MKTANFAIFAVLGLLNIALDTNAEAGLFHQRGLTDCTGCHMAKQSRQEGVSQPFDGNGTDEQEANPFLLNGPDPSSTCLNCHAKTKQVLTRDGSAFTPGGDFFWLTKSYNKSGYYSPGESHGHNIIAVKYNLREDSNYPLAPSDGVVEYQSSWLGCTSCHDPHAPSGEGSGAPGSGPGFRMLGGVGYTGGGQASGISFTNPPPVARSYSAPGEENWPAETNANHTDYGSGMSEWCTNCHSGMAAGLAHKHPVGNDAKLKNLAGLYNSYVASGDMSGAQDSAYDHFVPFERGVADPSSLSPTSTKGPDRNANVMCLTCHRAHASPFAHDGRWDFQATLLAEAPIFDSPEGANAYYGETIDSRYGHFQRSLCNKCHVKD